MKRQFLFGLLMILVASLLTACGGGGSTSIADTATPTPTQVVITTSAVLLTETGQTKALSARVLDSQGREMTTTVAWESTQPGQISVDSAGQVTALGEGGSAQITARVGELKSAPLLVFHSRVPAGTLLLTDAQIVGEPVETDPGATPSISNSYSVRLSGVAAPSVGQLVLNTEAKVVVGRVQVVQTDASGVHTVTLVLVPLREILPTLRIDETIDLSQAELTIPAAVLDTYDVVREGTRLTFTPKAARESARLTFTSKTVRTAASVSPAAVSGTVALPPFTECEATVEGAGGAGSLPIVLSKVPGFSLDFKPALDILHTPEHGLERLVLAAEPSITTDLSLEFSAGFDAKLTCGIELAVVRIPTPGPLAAFLSGLITFGAGMELSGKMALPGVVKITNVTRRASTLDLGVACPNGGSCSLVSEVGQPTVTNQASITGPDLGDVRLEPSLYGYGKAQLSIGNPFFSSLRFNAFYAKLGAALQTSFASREGQIADAAYQSSYGISALLKAGVDTDFAGLAAWLGLNGVAENLLEFSEPLATSPKGTLTLTQATFQSGERVEATVNFDPESTTFLSIYNIDEVILMRKVGTGPAQEVSRSTVGDGLARMSLSFVPESDGTASELYAFVTSRALPAQMLELGQAQAQTAPQLTSRRITLSTRSENDSGGRDDPGQELVSDGLNNQPFIQTLSGIGYQGGSSSASSTTDSVSARVVNLAGSVSCTAKGDDMGGSYSASVGFTLAGQRKVLISGSFTRSIAEFSHYGRASFSLLKMPDREPISVFSPSDPSVMQPTEKVLEPGDYLLNLNVSNICFSEDGSAEGVLNFSFGEP